jgi:hypothetical protein
MQSLIASTVNSIGLHTVFRNLLLSRKSHTYSTLESCLTYWTCFDLSCTTGKHHSFIGVFKFVGTDEYIQIIFIGPETDEYKLIFVGFDQASMNIWAIQFEQVAHVEVEAHVEQEAQVEQVAHVEQKAPEEDNGEEDDGQEEASSRSTTG